MQFNTIHSYFHSKIVFKIPQEQIELKLPIRMQRPKIKSCCMLERFQLFYRFTADAF